MNRPAALPFHPSMRHPLTGEPLQAIAIHPRMGTPVWPMMGGAPKDDEWSKAFEGKTPEQVKQELADATTATAQWQTTFKGKKPDEVKAESKRWEKRARRDHAKLEAGTEDGDKSKGKSADDKDKGKGKQTDDDKAAAAVAEARRENAILKLAPDLGANARTLVDSRGFMAKVSNLDPASPDFEKKLEKRIEKTLAAKGGDRYAAAVQGGDGRPRRDPRQGRESKGKTGSLESGRTAFQERQAQRKAGRITA